MPTRRRRIRPMARSASTRREWTGRSRRATISTIMPTAPGRRTRRSRRTSRLTACSACWTTCRAAALARSSTRRRTIRGSKIGNAYASFLDTATIEAKGLAPIQPWLNRINGLQSKAGYAALAAEAARNGIGGPIGAFVNQDDKDPNVYALSLVQAGLGMPDRDYYLSNDPKLAETRAAYQAHLAKMLTLAGRARCRRARRGDRRLSRPRSPRRTGPASRAAMRPRPITR